MMADLAEMATEVANILVVEDEISLRDSLAANLEGQGHRVIVCNSNQEGLVCLQQTPPDIVIANLALSDAGGPQILEILKEMKPEAALISITNSDRWPP